MMSPALLSRLRGTSLWPRVRSLHRRIALPVCAVIHTVSERIGHHRLPRDLALKHVYDYHVAWLDPRLIQWSLHVGEWARPDPSERDSRLMRLRRWLALGGGWKHLQQHPSRNLHGRFVAAGDWDLRCKPFVVRPTVTDLFIERLSPPQTLEYRKMRKWVESGRFAWTRGCRTVEEVDQYFADLIRLYDTIQRDGYRTQADLGHNGADEIRICIDRDGRPCVFGGGTHRLSIALLLGIDRVPVIVKRVHALWVKDCLSRYATKDVLLAVSLGIDALQQAVPQERPLAGGEASS